LIFNFNFGLWEHICRVDLANIVRRRGYKFIKELVANSGMEEDCNELVADSEDNNTNIKTGGSRACLEDLSKEAEEQGSLSKDESSLVGVSSMENSLSNLGASNHSGQVTENNLKIESVELNMRADIENSSSEASISANYSQVLDDTSSCPDIEAGNVSMTEDEEVNDVDKDFSLTFDHYTSPTSNHYTSPDLNSIKHVDIATGSSYDLTSENTMTNVENFQNQQIDDIAANRSGSADDSLVESEDKDWMSGLCSCTSSIEEKTTRFIQNGYLDTVDGMFDLLKPTLILLALIAYMYMCICDDMPFLYLHYSCMFL